MLLLYYILYVELSKQHFKSEVETRKTVVFLSYMLLGNVIIKAI